jgi:hypothetical protein
MRRRCLREGVCPAYIARWGEPQPSDQTDLKQWLRCVVGFSSRPSEKGEVSSRQDQASWPSMWGRLAPLVSL